MLSDQRGLKMARLLRWWYLPLVVVILSGCSTGPYFEPSASAGKVSVPAAGSAYGLFPKNTITFTVPDYPFIHVSVTAWTRVGKLETLQIEAYKIYFSDPRYKNLPYDQANAEIAKDREEVVADTNYIEVDWSDGKKQIEPLSFSRNVGGHKFVISGEPVVRAVINGQPTGPGRLPLPAAMSFGLSGNNSSAFDLKIPVMSFSGHRLEFPVIHFRRVE
jgi:hypothetical protein